MTRSLILRYCSAVLLVFTWASPASGDIIHVYEGESIQAAIDACSNGDEIIVHSGTYYEQIDFLGKAIWLHSSDGAEVTIIDAQQAGTVVTCNSDEGPDTILDGFTITGGNTGGMYNSYADPTVTNCTFSGNSAEYGGGGMFNWRSSPTVTNCTFSGNSAYDGGGMYNVSCCPTLTNCTFSGNTADERGGGMYNDSSSPTVTDCTFSANSSGWRGGGIYILYGFNASIRPTVTNCTFSGNSAMGDGGGMCNDSSSPTVTNCTFSGNSAGAKGGGLYAHDDVTLVNCTLTGNSADVGGGMYNRDDVAVSNCTFSGNTATTTGGAMYNKAYASVTLANCILWNSDPGPFAGSGDLTVTYSDIEGGFPGYGNIDLDPLFVDPDGGDYHIDSGSPCIDAADNTAVPADSADLDEDGDTDEQIPFDLDGNPRFVDEPGICDTGYGTPPIVDMGAYEFQDQTDPPDCNDNGVSDCVDIAEGTSQDCNGNAVPDECDIADGTSEDTNSNGVPDECELIHNVTQGTYHQQLGQAIMAAADGDEIIVAPGTYYENINFLGKAVWLHSSDGPAVTIIDGAGGGTVVTCDSDEGPDTVLEGFTITGGNGGMRNAWSSPTVTNCTFSGNSANEGGGMRNQHSSPTVTDCTFSGNSASDGGGMYNSSSSPTVTNCTFTGNSAHDGGGMCNWVGSPTVTNCTFSGNSAYQGGGMGNHESLATVTNCTFSGNSATGHGGGMRNEGAWSPTVTNCTFSGNSAHKGGGMRNIWTSPTVTNCQFVGNFAASAGGTMYSTGSWSRPNVRNCILWANTPNEITDESGALTKVRYSDVQGGWPGEGNIDADPLFVDPDNSDYRLTAGSPCIDAGNNTAVPPEITTDLDGNPRFINDPCTEDTGNGDPPIVDMGAYEFQPPCPSDFDCDGTVGASDLLHLLGAWGAPDGDVDGDGDTDTADLLALLGAWGECP